MIQGADGSSIGADKLAALRDNSNYFRSELEALGLHVYGDYDSPVIPVLLYNPTKVRKRCNGHRAGIGFEERRQLAARI